MEKNDLVHEVDALTNSIKQLGRNNADTSIGAIELLASERIAESINNIACELRIKGG